MAFRKWAPLAQLFEAPDLRHMEVRISNIPLLIEVNCDFSVPLDPSDRFDDYRFLTHDHPQADVTSKSR